MNEDEFFDAIDATLDKLEKDEEKVSLRKPAETWTFRHSLVLAWSFYHVKNNDTQTKECNM